MNRIPIFLYEENLLLDKKNSFVFCHSTELYHKRYSNITNTTPAKLINIQSKIESIISSDTFLKDHQSIDLIAAKRLLKNIHLINEKIYCRNKNFINTLFGRILSWFKIGIINSISTQPIENLINEKKKLAPSTNNLGLVFIVKAHTEKESESIEECLNQLCSKKLHMDRIGYRINFDSRGHFTGWIDNGEGMIDYDDNEKQFFFKRNFSREVKLNDRSLKRGEEVYLSPGTYTFSFMLGQVTIEILQQMEC